MPFCFIPAMDMLPFRFLLSERISTNIVLKSSFKILVPLIPSLKIWLLTHKNNFPNLTDEQGHQAIQVSVLNADLPSLTTLLSVSQYYHNLYHDLIIYELTTLISQALLESHTTKKLLEHLYGLTFSSYIANSTQRKHVVVEFNQ